MSSFLRASPLIVIACFALAASALAAGPKPDFAITTKSIEATVVLDAAIKADPPLAADCLAEGQKWAQKQRTEADAARKEMPDAFRQGGWSVERKYEQRSLVADRYVSVVRNEYTNTGGAHPNLDLDTILWDRTAAKRISIRPFFKETANGGPTLKFLASSIIDAVKIAKKARHNGEDTETDWIETIQPSLLKLGPVTLAPSTEAGKSSGLTFHFAATALGVHAEGGYVAFVPWQKLQPYLTPEGVAIFGGARPAGDDDGLQ
uniref:DUF3298 domain-containing protein n=1 Tax=Rhodopseudomonas palustris (strain BisA53) TaxID=316055 RepID=Q07QI9_RHOP5